MSIAVGSFADVIFAVDGSIKQHAMKRVASLIGGALEQYTISSTNTRVALVQYGEAIQILHDLAMPDKKIIKQKLDAFSFSKGIRNIPTALREMASKVFAKSLRPGAKLKIFMFVAGPTDEVDTSQVQIVANELKEKKVNVQFVYIGDHSSNVLLPLVNNENDITHVASNHEIAFALDVVLKMKGVKQGKNIMLY